MAASQHNSEIAFLASAVFVMSFFLKFIQQAWVSEWYQGYVHLLKIHSLLHLVDLT